MNIKALRGTYDILPPQSSLWEQVEQTAREIFSLFGYSQIRTPIFEQTQLFSRSIGEATDIVSKEMYTFPDRKGRSITLRPEATAPVVRAFLEHKLYTRPMPQRLFYIGPMFRYERPQAGRNRQFYQLGTEILGSTHPFYDAESIALAVNFFKNAGIKDMTVKINSVGDTESKQNYTRILKSYFKDKLDNLCPDCTTRYESNTLRMLDCKVASCRQIIKDAPPIDQNLNEESKIHFDTVKSYLDTMGINYTLDPCLVRGLDYYTNTIFEIAHNHLGSQDALGGGGRYNNLVKQLGGPDTGAVGFAVGIDRLIIVLEQLLNQDYIPKNSLDLYILNMDNAMFLKNVKLLHLLRTDKIKTDLCTEQKSFKAQMRTANKLGARFVLIQGQNEIDKNIVKIKNMETGTEEDIPVTEQDSLSQRLAERIRKS